MDLSEAKQIEGHEDYWVFPDGRVWSNRTRNGKFICSQFNREEYPVVSLQKPRPLIGVKSPPIFIHTLVARAFIGPRPVGEDGKPMQIDHIDQNKQNNNVDNLRYVTRQQNGMNRGPQKNNTSGYKGVFLWNNSDKNRRRKGNWYSLIRTGAGGRKYLGSFHSKIEAAKAYDKKVYELHGDIAYLNFPEDYGL